MTYLLPALVLTSHFSVAATRTRREWYTGSEFIPAIEMVLLLKVVLHIRWLYSHEYLRIVPVFPRGMKLVAADMVL